MSFTVTMPQLGETVTEGTILRWVKQPGDTVAEDDVLLEISTDKVDTEVPSPYAGTMLEILIQEGETVDVGTELCVIGEPGESTGSGDQAAEPAPEPAAEPAAESASEPDQPAAEQSAAATGSAPESASESTEPAAEQAAPATGSAPEPASEPAPEPDQPVSSEQSASSAPAPGSTPSGADLGVLSPVVRRLASEHDVDLSAISGSGRDGRITRRDVEAAIEAGTAAPTPEPEPAEEAAPATEPAPAKEVEPSPEPAPAAAQPSAAEEAPAAAEAPAAPAPAPVAGAGERVEQIDRLRSRIAENMVKAKETAAHVWTSMEVDFEHVERIRQKHKAAFKEREGFGLTYLPFISRAVMDALAQYPVVNSSFDLEAGTRTFHGNVNLGIGVDLNQEGLVVMTIRGADGLRMRGIAREVRRLAEKARGGNMEPDDLSGSTFTITNPGPFGSFMSAPIINVPNVAILSTDGIKKRPVVVTDENGNDAIAIHHVGFLGLTWDHRAFDGSTAVLFLKRIKENLENWDWEQELA